MYGIQDTEILKKCAIVCNMNETPISIDKYLKCNNHYIIGRLRIVKTFFRKEILSLLFPLSSVEDDISARVSHFFCHISYKMLLLIFTLLNYKIKSAIQRQCMKWNVCRGIPILNFLHCHGENWGIVTSHMRRQWLTADQLFL